MEKRILVAFLLSLAVLYGSRLLFPPKPAEPATEQVSTSTNVGSSSSSGAAQKTAPTSATPPAPAATKVAEPVPETGNIQAEQQEDVQVENSLYSATISNHGALLRSFRLKPPYKDAEGKPIELIDAAGAEKIGWPFAISTGDPKLDEQISSANFVLKRTGDTVSAEYAANGVHVRKTMAFDPQNYLVDVQTEVTRSATAVPHHVVWQGGFGDQSIPPDVSARQIVYSTDGAFKRLAISGIKAPQDLSITRIGVEDQYFLAMALEPNAAINANIRKAEYPGTGGKAVATSQIAIPASDRPLRFYIGPKEPKWLTKADPQLAGIIDYGFFSIVARPLNVALLWINNYIKNFGWSIIILTVIITLVMFPLRLKQQVSMQKMQKIQPQMRTLQDKYKKLKANDPKRIEIQSQMMNVYKEHGINPMSGCLPLLLQMPFLFAIYAILRVAIDLRGAPWILWIKDLSQPDPYFILPILMAITMFVSQKMTPTTVDPAQAKMMMVMPLMFTAMFLWAKSGLVLYWLTSNLVSVGQQYFINKYSPVTAPAKSRPEKKNDRAG
jgi:YidC/Oxa1 family membrane protein insertase